MEPNQPNNTILNKESEPKQSPETAQIKGQYELVLNWYKINGKNLLGEEVLKGLPIKTLLNLLGNPIWNHIYHCWAVESKHMSVLQAYTEHVFDPDKYTYFIEVYNNN